MASTPLLIGLTVRISGTATPDLNVTTTNEATSQSQTLPTGEDGKVIFNLGSRVNFSKGWNVGDKVSVVSINLSQEQKFSFTIPDSGKVIVIKDASNSTIGSFTGGIGITTGVLDLVSAPSLPSIRYFTPQEFLDYYELKTTDVDSENGISLLHLKRIGQGVEQEIDSFTNSKFDDNSGSFYATSSIDQGESPEYHDVRYATQKDYFMRMGPISSVTTFQKNNNAEGVAPDWETLTEADNNIAVDKATRRITIIDFGELPEIGARHVRVTYLIGRSTTPEDIKELAIMMTARKMVQAAFIKSRILKLDDTTTGDISEFTEFKKRILRKYRIHSILPT